MIKQDIHHAYKLWFHGMTARRRLISWRLKAGSVSFLYLQSSHIGGLQRRIGSCGVEQHTGLHNSIWEVSVLLCTRLLSLSLHNVLSLRRSKTASKQSTKQPRIDSTLECHNNECHVVWRKFLPIPIGFIYRSEHSPHSLNRAHTEVTSHYINFFEHQKIKTLTQLTNWLNVWVTQLLTNSFITSGSEILIATKEMRPKSSSTSQSPSVIRRNREGSEVSAGRVAESCSLLKSKSSDSDSTTSPPPSSASSN